MMLSLLLSISLAWASEIDPGREIRPELLHEAVGFYNENLRLIKNQTYVVIVDFKVRDHFNRFYVVNMETGHVIKLHVSHGVASDPDHDGWATEFSNRVGSKQSSFGPYLTAETYHGKLGYSLRLDGLSETNSNARKRAIVIHGARYVHEKDGPQGRSWGCFGLDQVVSRRVINLIKGGALLYAGRS
jgi:hypothetical protein